MAISAAQSSGPGVSVGPTSEFSLFFRVKPGEGESLRAALNDSAADPRVPARGLRHGDHDDPRGAVRAVRRRHPARIHHELRRPVGRLHGGLLHLRDRRSRFSTSSSGTRRATTGLPDLAAEKAFILGAQQSAAAYARNYAGTVKEIRKAQRVNAAFQRVLDHPDAAEALQHPALQPLLDEAAD